MNESSKDRMVVALIGLGQMGLHMANHVAAAGFELRVFDIRVDAMSHVDGRAVRASSAAEAAEGAGVIGVIVFDDDQVAAVLSGQSGVLETVAPGAVIAIHSTIRVDSLKQFAALAEQRGARLIDAGISGGEVGSRAGTLATMVGGDEASVSAALPVLEAFSARVIHAGPLGCGMALKLCRNLVGYLISGSASEGIALARAAGLDPAVLEDTLRATNEANLAQLFAPFKSVGGSSGGDGGTVSPDFLRHGMALAEKDLDQILALGASLGVELPMGAHTREHYRRRGSEASV